MKKLTFIILAAIVSLFIACGPISTEKSDSGVEKASTTVKTDVNGHTVEQTNIIDRLSMDNTPGSIKYLYVISAYSGDVLIYSTVKGKVTSSGKRLTPVTVAAMEGEFVGRSHHGMLVDINGSSYYTPEVLQDDGTYGTSDPYIYWFDSRGIFHQHYISGGQIIHVSSQPLLINKPIINMELTSPVQVTTKADTAKK